MHFQSLPVKLIHRKMIIFSLDKLKFMSLLQYFRFYKTLINELLELIN